MQHSGTTGGNNPRAQEPVDPSPVQHPTLFIQCAVASALTVGRHRKWACYQGNGTVIDWACVTAGERTPRAEHSNSMLLQALCAHVAYTTLSGGSVTVTAPAGFILVQVILAAASKEKQKIEIQTCSAMVAGATSRRVSTATCRFLHVLCPGRSCNPLHCC
jgi:hypothetical protein